MSQRRAGSTSRLAANFEQFAADDVECDGCGDTIRPKHAVDGRCPGCRYGDLDEDHAREQLEAALEEAENPLVRQRIREAIQLRMAAEEEVV